MISSRSPSRLHRLLAHLHEGGVRRVLAILGLYGYHRNFPLWFTDVQVLGLPDATARPAFQPLAGYQFRLANSGDLEAVVNCAPPEERGHLSRLFRRFMHAKSRCAVALHGETVAGYIWSFTGEYVITLDDYRQRNLQVRLDPVSVFTGNAYVMPAHRQRGLFRHLKLFLMQTYPRGTRFYTWINELNFPSLAVNRRLGFRRLATLRFVGLFSRTLLFLRAADDSRWRGYRARWPVFRIEGERMQTVPEVKYLPVAWHGPGRRFF